MSDRQALFSDFNCFYYRSIKDTADRCDYRQLGDLLGIKPKGLL